MKKIGIRVLSVLILVSVFIISSVAVVNAAPPQRLFIEITDMDAGVIQVSFNWTKLGVHKYRVDLLKDGTALDNTGVVSFSRRTPQYSDSVSFVDTAITCNSTYEARIYVYNKSGRPIKRGNASDTAYLTCSVNAIHTEDFGGFTSGQLPPGWTGGGNYTDRIEVDNWNGAGGSAPELYFNFGTFNITEIYYTYTPSIDATSATSTLALSFKHFHQYYTGETPPVSPPYTIAVDVSTDGGTTWGATSFVHSPTANIGPETASVDLGAYKGNTINIRWRISGYTYWTDGWSIDDIVVTGS